MNDIVDFSPGASSADQPLASGAWPRSVLVIGCGLLGTSFVLAVSEVHPDVHWTGIEPNVAHRDTAAKVAPFEEMVNAIDALPRSVHFDLAVLASPLNAACASLGPAASVADIVIDLCSAKVPICQAAVDLGLQGQFAPTHPMAGLAVPGPRSARADLFVGQPWLVLRGWPAVGRITALLSALGANVIELERAADHDEAMAAASHAIHLTSLSAMLAFEDAQQASGARWATLTGPGFRDITRLAGSPTGFWVDVLTTNAVAVREQLARVVDRLQAFEQALDQGDDVALAHLLNEARSARARWSSDRLQNNPAQC